MNVIQLIWAELKEIVSKPHHIVVMVAVMCVPLLYAGMFLYGFWDAFGKTGNLPVAVVNQDNGAKIAGKQIEAGHDLVTNLKKNHDFKWQFVSEKAAQDGFKNNHYFMIVRIPSSFSKNATTLSDNQLKPANIHYRINRDYNFISGKMADAGMQKLKARLSSEITKTYAKTMYTQINQLTKGLGTAAKGSNDLTRGSKSEVAGLNQLKNGYKSLLSGTTKLQSGAGKLADGASQLYSGAGQLSGGASAVSTGAGKLNTGASTLSGGASKIASGNSQLSSGAGKLADGATSLSSGAGQLGQGISQYTGAVGNQLLPGANKLTSGLTQLNGGIQSQNLVGQVNQLNSGMQEFNSIIQGLPVQINNSINPATIGEAAKQQTIANQSAIENGAVSQAGDLKSQSDAAASKITDSTTNSINNSKSDISSALKENLTTLLVKTIKAANPSMNDLDANSLATQILDNKSQTSKLTPSDEITSTIIGNINQGISNQKSTISASLTTEAEKTIKQTASGTAQQVAQQTASSTASQIKSGIASSFTQKDPTTGLTLNSAAQQLASGTSQLAGSNGIPLIASSVNQLTSGSGQLYGGLNTLNGNSSALTSGAAAVKNGASSLSGGASSLSGGASTLANGASSLAGGATSLANGASSLSSGSQQLVSGTNRISSGAGALTGGANALASGLNSAASGQQKLASGTNQAASGAQKIYSGNQKLGSSLSDAHSQLAKTPTNNAHATKFSQPVTSIDGSHQSVGTFGSGFAPYFICIGLFVGALLLTIIYDLGKPAGLATAGWNIALSKYFITILMSVCQALLVDLVVLKGLGLQVDHPLTFIGFTILTSMSFMAIIQWLAGSFNNEGRFVAIVILLFQLVTSGGAYAVELIPKWLQHVSPLFPMTYAVNGFRNLIDGNQQAMLARNAVALLVFILIFLTLSMITFSIKFHYNRTHGRSEQIASQSVIGDDM